MPETGLCFAPTTACGKAAGAPPTTAPEIRRFCRRHAAIGRLVAKLSTSYQQAVWVRHTGSTVHLNGHIILITSRLRLFQTFLLPKWRHLDWKGSELVHIPGEPADEEAMGKAASRAQGQRVASIRPLARLC